MWILLNPGPANTTATVRQALVMDDLCHPEPEFAEVARVAHALGRHVIVDAMSSLFGERLDVTQDGIDFVAASANKCLQGIPGVSFVLARRSAIEALAGMPPRSIYLDVHSHYVSQ